MRTRTMLGICSMLVVALTVTGAFAARKKAAPPPTPLTEVGEQLQAKYTAMLDALRQELIGELPQVDESRKAAYAKAREAQKAAEATVAEATQRLGKLGKAQGLVNHATNVWIAKADRNIAKAKEQLSKAATPDERAAAEKALAAAEKNRQEGVDALNERQALLEEAKRDEPAARAALDAAEAALSNAKMRTVLAIAGMQLDAVLSNSRMDGKLAKFIVMSEATPHGLAVFAQQGKQHEALIDKLLSDARLMVQMAVADGAAGGKYGRAMEIYTAIQKASQNVGEGVLQRLAVAVALEHATPHEQRSATGKSDAPTHVDPVKRYLSYEKAFLNGELDPGFKSLSVWDYRMVVDGEEPDETAAWGRKMLRNYRPDHVTMSDYRWRYVAAVRTEIRYGSQDNKYDQPDLQFFQNILKNGGVCGRRAFFGRFILRAFGVPTTARPQPGHAALTHWTPDGWVICLGAGWGKGTTKTRYKKDLDFLATTQAREDRAGYMQVKRAQWIGDVVGEKPVYGFHAGGDPGFWYGVSLYTQQGVIERAKAQTLAAVGEELGEANVSDVKYDVESAEVTNADRKITVEPDGTITIPATACSNPTKSTDKLVFMASNLGGKQLHSNRNGKAEPFEYTFEAPRAGKYALTARVVTPSWKQHLLVGVNGSSNAADIALPFTVGMWDTTDPVEIELTQGRNVLSFLHQPEEGAHAKGVTIRDFTLKPVK
jgi:hypothetical protein